MSTTVTETARVMTFEVPVASGDILRAIKTPAVSPPTRVSPPPAAKKTHRRASSAASDLAKAGHRRTSSAASDLAKAVGIDIEAVSMSEARKIMSEEHKVLGFRPPHGSFAAEVQSVAAKHPDGKAGALVDTSKLKELAREDALRILAERKTNTSADSDALPSGAKAADKPMAPARHSPPNPGINLNTISAADARALMSHEHRALGFRPPPGSLAAEAQAAAARHPEGDGSHLGEDTLREIALRDAERIKADREMGGGAGLGGKEGAAENVEPEGDGHPEDASADPVLCEAVLDAAEEEAKAETRANGTEVETAPADTPTPEIAHEAGEGEEAKDGIYQPKNAPEPESEPELEPKNEDALGLRTPPTPPLVRTETGESEVEIVCEVLV